MSRMLAYFGATAATVVEAVGPDAADQFAALALVHSDGWGTAWVGEPGASPHATRDTVPLDPAGGWGSRAPEPAVGRLLYLRFASRGAAVRLENVQPFVSDGIAFQHNGAFARDRALPLLSASGRAALRGTTDSEVYFRLTLDEVEGVAARRHASPSSATYAASLADAMVAAADALRRLFPEACLNAYALTAETLLVVHSAGTISPPSAAFASRGLDLAALPSGHDEQYNVLLVHAERERVIVTTSGVSIAGLRPLPPDSLTVFELVDGRVEATNRLLGL